MLARGLLAIVFVYAFVASLRLVGIHSDLTTYVDAAREMVAGGLDIYRSHEGVGTYPYPHFVLLPFAALDSVLGYDVLCVVYGLSLALTTVWIFANLGRIARHLGDVTWCHWALFGFLFVRAFSTSYRHGQLSLHVSACMLHGVVLLADRGRDVRGGVWLGLAAALKLTPALLLVLLAVTGRLKALAAMATTIAVCVFLLPWPVLGTAEHVRHLGDFGNAVILPRFGVETTNEFFTGQSMSIAGAFPYAFRPTPPTDRGYQFWWTDLGERGLSVAILVWSLAVLALCVRAYLRTTGDRIADWYHRCSVFMLAMVLFSPLTRTYHLTGIALTGMLFCRDAPPRSRRSLYWGAVLMLALAMTLRQRWLVGSYAWWFLDHSGLGHVALVALLCWSAFRPRCADDRPPSGIGWTERGSKASDPSRSSGPVRESRGAHEGRTIA